MTRETTWDAHSSFDVNSANSSIVSVDFATGTDRVVEVNTSGVKIYPQYLGNTSSIGYLLKGTTKGGIYSGTTYYNTTARSPAWSPDGKRVVYEKVSWDIRPQNKLLYSWDANWTYRFIDVFPTINTAGRLAITQKQLGDSAVISLNATGTDNETVFDPVAREILSLSSVEQAPPVPSSPPGPPTETGSLTVSATGLPGAHPTAGGSCAPRPTAAKQ